ncbi:MAG: hypothetical protein IKW39_04490 [Alphaproteobacteria bacterium]|nr:hypothetical protein [Alphaproteobacteria bacterium]
MKIWKSCRFSRICERNAVDRAGGEILLLLVCFFVLYFTYKTCLFYGVLGVSLLLSLVLIWKIVKADDYYELKSFGKDGKVKLYIYEYDKQVSQYVLYIEYKGLVEVLYIDDYEFFGISKKRDWFIFAVKNDWYCQHFDETVALGKRYGRAVFIDQNKDDVHFLVSALSLKNEIKSYVADKFFFGRDDLFIPELIDNEYRYTDYILIKVEGKYKLISSSFVLKKKREMTLAGIEKHRSIVFREDGKTVVLVWDDTLGEYKEIYRGVNYVSSLKSIVELDGNNLPSNGVVYKFDKRHKSLVEVYKGEIVFIDEKRRRIVGHKDDDFYSY